MIRYEELSVVFAEAEPCDKEEIDAEVFEALCKEGTE